MNGTIIADAMIIYSLLTIFTCLQIALLYMAWKVLSLGKEVGKDVRNN